MRLDGFGHRPGGGASGYQVIVREVNSQLVEKGAAIDREESGAAGYRRERSSAADRDQIPRPYARNDETGGSGGLRHRDRSDRRAVACEEGTVQRARQDLPAGDDFRKQHVFDFDHGNGDDHAAARSAFVGMHFFNPVPVMKLVEVIRTIATDRESFRGSCRVCRRGWARLRCARPTAPGFIVNRLLVPYLLDAVRVLEQGLASIEDIDNSMKLGCGYPMGPLDAARFRGARHNLLHCQHHVRRIQGAAFRAAAAAEAHGAGRMERPEGGTRIL